MTNIPIGTFVTAKVPMKAWYSNYGGRPKQYFLPGMAGIVAARVTYGKREFTWYYCVDFIGDNGKVWRVGLHPTKEMCILKNANPSEGLIAIREKLLAGEYYSNGIYSKETDNV